MYRVLTPDSPHPRAIRKNVPNIGNLTCPPRYYIFQSLNSVVPLGVNICSDEMMKNALVKMYLATYDP